MGFQHENFAHELYEIDLERGDGSPVTPAKPPSPPAVADAAVSWGLLLLLATNAAGPASPVGALLGSFALIASAGGAVALINRRPIPAATCRVLALLLVCWVLFAARLVCTYRAASMRERPHVSNFRYGYGDEGAPAARNTHAGGFAQTERFTAPARFPVPERYPVPERFPAPEQFPPPMRFPAPERFPANGRFAAPEPPQTPARAMEIAHITASRPGVGIPEHHELDDVRPPPPPAAVQSVPQPAAPSQLRRSLDGANADPGGL